MTPNTQLQLDIRLQLDLSGMITYLNNLITAVAVQEWVF
jgi:hypothetical protein